MRRLITIPLLLLVLATYGQAQEDNSEKNSSNVNKNDFEWKTHKFFFRLGFSTARGDYSSTEPRDDAGFADVGRNIEFGYEVRINENFGIMMRYSNMRHGIEEGEYANEINNQLIAATNMTDFSSRASFDNYRFNNFLVSPRLYNRIGKNSYFLITPTIGFSSMVIGQLQVTSFNDQFTIVAVQEETTPGRLSLPDWWPVFHFRSSRQTRMSRTSASSDDRMCRQ